LKNRRELLETVDHNILWWAESVGAMRISVKTFFEEIST